jgi:hypothetical protein
MGARSGVTLNKFSILCEAGCFDSVIIYSNKFHEKGVVPMTVYHSRTQYKGFGVSLVLLLPMPCVGLAQEAATAPVANPGDTAWVLTSTALVMLMTLPGLALFYGGLVRSKNVLGTIMHSAVILCLVSLIWVLWGYSLAFGPDRGGIIGGLDWVGLHNVGTDPHPTYGPTIPHQVFMLFQLMFAAITPALITGAFAERITRSRSEPTRRTGLHK